MLFVSIELGGESGQWNQDGKKYDPSQCKRCRQAKCWREKLRRDHKRNEG